jgi:hypothetical protein
MLNPKKYVFGVSSGKLLGYMVLSRGIDANQNKVEAIEKLRPPQTRKEIQKLAGMWQLSVSSYLSWENMVCHSTSYYTRQMVSSGMNKQQWLLSSSSSISRPYQNWYHPSPMMCYYYMLPPLMQLSALSSQLNGRKPRRKSSNSLCILSARSLRMLKQDTRRYRSCSMQFS